MSHCLAFALPQSLAWSPSEAVSKGQDHGTLAAASVLPRVGPGGGEDRDLRAPAPPSPWA